jgi:mitotic spindle assembly checkpoint protein MAD2
MSSTSSSTAITLRGSTEIVTEFFDYAVNSILYQRGIYPPESFSKAQKYGLTTMITADPSLKTYLSNVTRQLETWLMNNAVQKLVLVVKGVETGDTLERWVFECVTVGNHSSGGSSSEEVKSDKPMKEITAEIQAIIRQITASVTFLPLLNEPCSFDLLVYADDAATVPVAWEDSDPCFIADAEDVRLRSFTTKIHKVDLKVSYKVDDV